MERGRLQVGNTPLGPGFSAASGSATSFSQTSRHPSSRLHVSISHTISQDCTQERAVHTRRLCALGKRDREERDNEDDPYSTPIVDRPRVPVKAVPNEHSLVQEGQRSPPVKRTRLNDSGGLEHTHDEDLRQSGQNCFCGLVGDGALVKCNGVHCTRVWLHIQCVQGDVEPSGWLGGGFHSRSCS